MTTVLSELRRIGLDLPYRYFASLMGLAAVAALFAGEVSRPSDAVEGVARWAGLDLSNQVESWVRWVTAPERAHLIAGVGATVVWVSLLVLAAQAARVFHSRAASTVFIGLALYLEARGDGFDADWVWLAIFAMGWVLYKLKHEDATR
jgi:hypothetical protein